MVLHLPHETGSADAYDQSSCLIKLEFKDILEKKLEVSDKVH